MCSNPKKESVDKFIDVAVYIVILIWINNSVFSVLKLVWKIVEFVKSRLRKGKVEPEKNKEISITSLET